MQKLAEIFPQKSLKESMGTVRWPVIIMAYLGLFSLGVLDNARGPFFPDLTHDLKISDFQASLFFIVSSSLAFVASQFSPRLLPRWGAVRCTRWGLVVMGVGFGLMAWAQTLPILLLFSGLFGIGLGSLFVFLHVAVEEGSPVPFRRQFLSGMHSLYALASLVAPMVIGWLFELGWTWRGGFVLAAAVPLLAALWAFMASSKESQQVVSEPSLKTNGHRLQLVLSGLVVALYVAGELTIATRLPLYLRREHGVSPAQASQFLAGFYFLLLLGRLFFTVFHLRHFSSAWIMKVSLGLSASLFVLGLFVHPYWLVGCGLTMAPFFAISMDFMVMSFPQLKSVAMAYAMALTSVLVVTMHLVVGYLSDRVGVGHAMIVGPICLCLSLLLLIQRTTQRSSLKSH